MLVILLLHEALDQWTVVSAQGIVVEGIAKRAIRGGRMSCCGGEGMRGRGLDWLTYSRTLAQPHEIKTPFTCTLDSKKLKHLK